MADYGRIQAIVIATVSGNVVYERFYDAFSDLDKADLRASLQEVRFLCKQCQPVLNSRPEHAACGSAPGGC